MLLSYTLAALPSAAENLLAKSVVTCVSGKRPLFNAGASSHLALGLSTSEVFYYQAVRASLLLAPAFIERSPSNLTLQSPLDSSPGPDSKVELIKHLQIVLSSLLFIAQAQAVPDAAPFAAHPELHFPMAAHSGNVYTRVSGSPMSFVPISSA